LTRAQAISATCVSRDQNRPEAGSGGGARVEKRMWLVLAIGVASLAIYLALLWRWYHLG
jgi:hypothetical protein